jgi:hypothetical protein
MKFLKRLAVLALPVAVAAVSMGIPAGAAPTTASAARTGPSAAASTSYLYNGGSVAVGVMYDFDGAYLQGNYDFILQPGQRTDSAFRWDHVGGYYIGPGYCAMLYNYQNGGWPAYHYTPSGPAWERLDLRHENPDRWRVEAWAC